MSVRVYDPFFTHICLKGTYFKSKSEKSDILFVSNQNYHKSVCLFLDPTRKHASVNPKHWKNREFSFTLKEDIYIRFKSYGSLSDFRDDIRKKCPYKIDIGACYNVEPCKKHTISSDKFIPEEKEFVVG